MMTCMYHLLENSGNDLQWNFNPYTTNFFFLHFETATCQKPRWLFRAQCGDNFHEGNFIFIWCKPGQCHACGWSGSYCCQVISSCDNDIVIYLEFPTTCTCIVPMLTLHMLNCFENYKRCTHILYHILDFVQQKKTRARFLSPFQLA